MTKHLKLYNTDKSLKNEESLHFNEFLLKLLIHTNRRNVIPIYRGEKLKNLYEKLEGDTSENNINLNTILSRLFIIGEKSKHFYNSEIFELPEKKQINLDELNEKVFSYIFDTINSSLKNKNRYIFKFFEMNKEFREYFNNKKNKPLFTNAILASNENDQTYFKFYYLKLIHQFGSINYKSKSHFVSSSRDYEIANTFAKDEMVNNSVIIHAWSKSNYHKSKFNRIGIPKYYSAPFKKQEEISVLAGILPHYIIGLEIVEKKILYINPHLFINDITDELIIGGLKINQENFDVIVRQTKYKRSFVVYDNKIHERNL